MKQPNKITTLDDVLHDIIARIERIEKTLKIRNETKLATSEARKYLVSKNKI